MRKEYSLRNEKDFRTLFSKGRRSDSRLFRIIVRENNQLRSRFAFIISRAIEKRAVRRNQVRRRAKEWIFQHPDFFSEPMDIALLFKKEAITASKKIFYEELNKTFKQTLGR